MNSNYDTYEARPDEGAEYKNYVLEYLNAMLVTDENGVHHLSRSLAGYVDHHGADCYKTAALVMKAFDENPAYAEVMAELYRDLTDPKHVNSKGDVVVENIQKMHLAITTGTAGPADSHLSIRYGSMVSICCNRFWLTMLPKIGDTKQLAIINERLNWVADVMLAPNGMYYHACNSREDVCAYHWTRAMGWYAMAMVDVMEVLPECYIEERKAALKLFADGMLKYQDESGLWANLADQPVTATNRLEVSGTAMMIYMMLKGVRKGWLNESYREPAIKAFNAIVNTKLHDNILEDIYLKASANNTNNYEIPEYYLPDEGKGSGPFIMAYSEMLYL